MGEGGGEEEEDADLALARALQAQYNEEEEEEEFGYGTSDSEGDFRPGGAKRKRKKKKKKAVAPAPPPPPKEPKPKQEPKPVVVKERKPPAPPKDPNRKKPQKSVYDGVDLKLLISLKLLKFGEKRIAHAHPLNGEEENKLVADLLEDGTIQLNANYDGNNAEAKNFKSAASFSMFVKKLTNPAIKFTDGWANVKYDVHNKDEVEKEESAKEPRWVSLKEIRARIDPENVENILPPKPLPEPKPPKKVKEPKPPKEPKPVKPPKSPKKKKRSAQEQELARAQKYANLDGPSLARDKPQRERKKTRHNYGNGNEEDTDLHMVSCENYREPKVRNVTTKGAQPFDMLVSPSCLLVMDYHSHLCSNEIIGFLGGTWDGEKRELKITRALPAKQLPLSEEDGNAGQEVELDPSSVPDIVEKLDANGERVVGWYHSHPVFPNQPSLRDIENQSNYQKLFNDAEVIDDGDNMSEEKYAMFMRRKNCPFVGAIVGPYDLRNPSAVSDIRYFHVCSDDPKETNPRNFTPFQLEQEIIDGSSGSDMVIDAPSNEATNNVNNSASKENKEPGVFATEAAPASPAVASAGASAEAKDGEGDEKKDETLSDRVEKGEEKKEKEEKGDKTEAAKKLPATQVQMQESSIHENFGTEDAMREMKVLTERFKPGAEEAAYVESVLMNEVWKDGETKINKLEKSLLARCPSQWMRNDKETYIAEIIGCLKSSWELEPNPHAYIKPAVE